MRTRSLTDLISDVRQRTNQENSTFVTDAEITEYLNQELAELWAHIVQGSGQPHYRSSYDIAVTAGTALYALPADFYEVQGVEITLNGITGAIHPFMPLERGTLASQGTWGAIVPVRYRIQAGNIEFLPSTQSFSATLYYTPSSPRLSAGGDTVDGFNGFEVAAIYGTCATILQKEESDSSFYVGQKERVYKHIAALAAHRDASHPERVQDISVLDPDWWTL